MSTIARPYFPNTYSPNSLYDAIYLFSLTFESICNNIVYPFNNPIITRPSIPPTTPIFLNVYGVASIPIPRKIFSI